MAEDDAPEEGSEVSCCQGRLSPLKVHHLRSAYFDDRSIFPPGSIDFDHAVLMRDIRHLWRSVSAMTTTGAGATGRKCASQRLFDGGETPPLRARSESLPPPATFGG